MKSYFLEAVSDEDNAKKTLSEILPSQADPWVLLTDDNREVIAYLNIAEGGEANAVEGPYFISADMSSRHFHEDQQVISLLRALRVRLGGTIRDDFDNVL